MSVERVVWLLTCPFSYSLYVVDMVFVDGALAEMHVAQPKLCRGGEASKVPEGGYVYLDEEGEAVYTDHGVVDDVDAVNAWLTLVERGIRRCVLLAEARLSGGAGEEI